jgi:hypothetical protein
MTRQLPNGCAGWHSPWLTGTGTGQAQRHHAVRRVNVKLSGTPDRAGAWLRGALAALAVLALAAAVVSWDAQYVLVRAVKHGRVVAGLEAGIPDVGALIFATLGIALALHGKRAIRPRGLNIACVAISLAMNALASAAGWRDLAIWVMPSAVYALASDTFIGVVRAWAIARRHASHEVLADDEATPMAIIGGVILWTLRLALAPASTIAGFRRWVVEECPVAPGRRALPAPSPPAALLARKPASGIAPAQAPARTAAPVAGARRPQKRRRAGQPGKQDRLLTLAAQRHDLTTLPLGQVSGIANQIGAEIGLSPGTARRVLLAHVRALQNGSTPPREAAS